MFGKKNSKKGFTLIELLSVIVILGILMLVAVPAVTRYIENSKKEAFIKEINSLVDTVRYGITSGDSNYQNKTTFYLKEIELEKGKNTVKEGILTVNTQTNTYRVRVTDEENNYCLSAYINNLNVNSIKDCNTGYEYVIGDIITYPDSDTRWYVIENAAFKQSYIVLLKEKALLYNEMDSDYAYSFKPINYSYTINYNAARYSTNGSNNYSTSNVKKAVESYMDKSLNSEELEPVGIDGVRYKIRLITKNELMKNLGYEENEITGNIYYKAPDETLSWVYSGFGEEQISCGNGYWTMTPNSNNSSSVWKVSYDGGFSTEDIIGFSNGVYGYPAQGVRPVINLKKSAIK